MVKLTQHQQVLCFGQAEVATRAWAATRGFSGGPENQRTPEPRLNQSRPHVEGRTAESIAISAVVSESFVVARIGMGREQRAQQSAPPRCERQVPEMSDEGRPRLTY